MATPNTKMPVVSSSRMGKSSANSTSDWPCSPRRSRGRNCRPAGRRSTPGSVDVTARIELHSSALARSRKSVWPFILLPLCTVAFDLFAQQCLQRQSVYCSTQERLLSAFPQFLQKSVQGPFIRGRHRSVAGFILQNKLKADAILAPTNGARVNADGAFRDFLSEGGILQGHQDEGSWVPAFFSDYVKAGWADVPDWVRFRRSACPVVSGQAIG